MLPAIVAVAVAMARPVACVAIQMPMTSSLHVASITTPRAAVAMQCDGYGQQQSYDQGQGQPGGGGGYPQGQYEQQGGGYGGQTLCVTGLSGVKGMHTLQPGQRQTLGRYDMLQQKAVVSREQCFVEVTATGAPYIVSRGKAPTGLRRNGQWYWLER